MNSSYSTAATAYLSVPCWTCCDLLFSMNSVFVLRSSSSSAALGFAASSHLVSPAFSNLIEAFHLYYFFISLDIHPPTHCSVNSTVTAVLPVLTDNLWDFNKTWLSRLSSWESWNSGSGFFALLFLGLEIIVCQTGTPVSFHIHLSLEILIYSWSAICRGIMRDRGRGLHLFPINIHFPLNHSPQWFKSFFPSHSWNWKWVLKDRERSFWICVWQNKWV